ncbi:Copper-fist domain-containing protein [Penicillium ucsense]|uniref:Copper-fist domain-containing protein n=1 Tax=Penicillium ucsense TaxID=2839758 RepID=A0A8J8W5J3_9EURO|nr:Copper-fist domain-containing protein [Penicillium ucsense]KAF7734403.1 Copper-fist domain-containing protein [Penicillium ucsense]
MLIDGQKWACEACIRGHRVSSCKHHDRPLIRIKRKGRPFATCTICHATPCEAPSEHARLKREAELKSPSSSSSKKASHGRLYPRHPSSNGFLPIAPRPSGKSRSANEEAGPSSVSGAEVSPSSAAVSRSGSVSAASVSSSCLPPPIRGSKASSSRRPKTRGSSVGEWSGSEGSGAGSGAESYGDNLVHLLPSTSSSMAGASVPLPVSSPEMTSRAGSSEAMARPPAAAASSSSLEPTTLDHPTMCETIFDPMYSLEATTSAAAVSAGLVATMPMLSPMEGANPFDFPLDPSLRLDEQTLGYLDDMNLDVDLSEGLADEVFAVEDWSRYMWSPENGFEHLDTDYPPVSQ